MGKGEMRTAGPSPCGVGLCGVISVGGPSPSPGAAMGRGLSQTLAPSRCLGLEVLPGEFLFVKSPLRLRKQGVLPL